MVETKQKGKYFLHTERKGALYMTEEPNKEHKEIEISDTWVDFLMYPLGIFAGALLAVMVDLFLR